MNGHCDALQARLDTLRQRLAGQELRRSICEELSRSRVPDEAAAGARCLDDVGRRINDLLPEIGAAEGALARCLADDPPPPALPITIAGVEQTQATQLFRPALQPCPDRRSADPCPENDIALIAGKATVLRAYVDVVPDRAPPVAGLSGILESRPEGSGTWDPPLTPYNAPVGPRRVADIDRATAGHTLNFRLPAARCRGTVECRLTVFDAAHPQEPGYTSVPVTRTLRFLRVAPLRIRLVRIRYVNAARGFDLAAPTVDDFWTTAEYVKKTFPTDDIRLEAESEELYDGDFTSLFDDSPGAVGTTGSVFTIIDRLQLAEGRVGDARVKYLALIPGPPANQGPTGWGVSPNRAVGEVFQGPVMAQEIAHTCGRGHAPCGVGNADPSYPTYGAHPSGSIGEFGFDVVTSDVYDPATSFDFMSYCLDRAWVSPYTYEALMSCFPAFSVTGELGRDRREVLYLPVRIYRDGAVKVRGAGFHLEGHLGAPADRAAPYFVELHGQDGTILEARRLRLDDVHRSLDAAAIDFLAALPWRDEAARVVFKRDDRLLHAIDVERAGPRVAVTAPRGGGTLTGRHRVAWTVRGGGAHTAILRYSHDGGQSWRAVATRLTASEHTVDVDGLPGGDDCRFQVLVSAGIRTGVARSDSFAVARKPLRPSIVAPRDGALFTRGDTVPLLGAASSPGGGSAEAAMLHWSSDVDGFLGAGSPLSVHTLSAGRHCIALRTDDTCGGDASTSIHITVRSRDAR